MSSGIQDNTTEIQIDVTYTKKGRQYKATNNPLARVTKFALSDDGVNYNLVRNNLPESDRYLKVERAPQFDAWTDGASLMKSLLFTVPRNINTVDSFSVDTSSLQFIPYTDGFESLGASSDLKSITGIRKGISISIQDESLWDSEEISVTLENTEYLFLSLVDGSNFQLTRRLPDRNSIQDGQTITLSDFVSSSGTRTIYVVYTQQYNGVYTNSNASATIKTNITIENKSGFKQTVEVEIIPLPPNV